MREKNNNITTKDFIIINVLKLVEEIFYYLEDKFTIICFTGMTFAILYGIIMRFLLRLPNQYGEEISRYLLVMSVFIGLGIVERENKHMKIDLISNILPKSISKIMNFTTRVITIVTYIWLSLIATNYVIRIYSLGQLSTCVKMPMYIMYGTLLIGFILGVLHSIIHLCRVYLKVEKAEPDKLDYEERGV